MMNLTPATKTRLLAQLNKAKNNAIFEANRAASTEIKRVVGERFASMMELVEQTFNPKSVVVRAKPKAASTSDQDHVIYRLTCKDTGETFIGITVADGNPKKAVDAAFSRLVHKATVEKKGWPVTKSIRKHNEPSEWKKEVLRVVGSKEEAHVVKRVLVQKQHPELVALPIAA